MSDTVIKVENVSKLYRLGEVGSSTVSDDLNRWWHKLQGKEDPYLKIAETNDRTVAGASDYVWSLKDVSFEVKRGQALGIIGRNGAGKSTLLKILSRVTTPTSGQIKIKGRIASLLEVGTGFNPDLTGRDNVYLNGAILGMRKREIDSKFDEIVAFSEVERYIDTPVKRYSSGMYVRLAFAVAAHLEPEILIVDEVLAVGDGSFQKKCLSKMQDVSRNDGRTILFVSHNMAAIKSLCDKGIFLQTGSVCKDGPMDIVLKEYLTEDIRYTGLWQREGPMPSNEGIFFEKAEIANSEGRVTGAIECTDDFFLNLTVSATRSFDDAQIAVRVTNHEGFVVFSTCNTDDSRSFVKIPSGRRLFRVKVPGNFLAPGSYNLSIAAHIPQVKVLDVLDKTLGLSIEETGSIETFCREGRLGVINVVFPWEHLPA